jgi:hypothetical protein
LLFLSCLTMYKDAKPDALSLFNML